MKKKIALIIVYIVLCAMLVGNIVLFFIDVWVAAPIAVSITLPAIITFVYHMAKAKWITHLPELTTKATIKAKNVVKKRVKTGKVYRIKIYYKITFETENHIQWIFDFSLDVYNAFIEGDYGTLVYKESKRKQIYYCNFFRIK